MLFLSESLMHIDVHVLYIIMTKKLENYSLVRDACWLCYSYRRFNSYWSGSETRLFMIVSFL